MTTATTKKPAAKKPAAKKPAVKKSRAKTSVISTEIKEGYQSKVGEAIQKIEEMMSSGKFELRWEAHPMNFVSKKRYSGVNLVLLAQSAMSDPEQRSSKYWLTFKQGLEHGLQVEKGQKSTHIVVWVNAKPKDEAEKQLIAQGLYKPRRYPIGHAVFNAKQMAGYEEEVPETSYSFNQQIERLESMMQQTGVTFSNSGDSAYYMPSKHHINLPNLADFVGDQEKREMLYLTTLTHELAHSTMKELRKEHHTRSMQGIDLDQTEYAKEEVVAELCSAMLCATLGIQKQTLPSHAGYIRGWLEKAKYKNPYYFTTACRLASQAHDYLMSFIDQSYKTTEAEAAAEQAQANGDDAQFNETLALAS